MKSKEEIEQLAEKHYTQITLSQRTAFKLGYTQCQEDMVDKKYTEEDLLHAFREGVLLPNSQIGIMEDIFKQVVHSLNNKQD
jgi:hypothetical protein